MDGHIEPKIPATPDRAPATRSAARPVPVAHEMVAADAVDGAIAAAIDAPAAASAIILDEPEPAATGETTEITDRSNETTAAGIPWLAFARYRTQIRQRWPVPWDLRVANELLAPVDEAGLWPEIGSVLDVGATDRLHEPDIRRRRPDVDYRSLDIDRSVPQDYHDFSEVDRTFDMVVCFEVLEHVDERTAVELVRQCASVLRPGGHLLISVPNLLVPYYQLEFTHCTAYKYDDLGALYALHGLVVDDIIRRATGSPRTRWIHRHLLGRWHRFMRTDFCSSVVCLGHRPRPGESGPAPTGLDAS